MVKSMNSEVTYLEQNLVFTILLHVQPSLCLFSCHGSVTNNSVYSHKVVVKIK